ncbi:hypothetical protein ACFE04_020874 [Oxalis oulophora]
MKKIYNSRFFSTLTTKNPLRGNSHSQHNQRHSLYRRISPVGDPTVSIVPILNQWVSEGKALDRGELHYIVKELRSFKRYTHALQVCNWMTSARYFHLTQGDAAVRLDLISKVHGIKHAETYFNNTPIKLKGIEVYGALLNCYAEARSVEKAEEVLQTMRDLGLAIKPLPYNVLLGLYKKTGNYEKLNNLMHEMETNNVTFDKYTYSICMNAYAANSDIGGMEKTLEKMMSDSRFSPDWCIYAAVANFYTKAGILDKALAMLKKAEGLVTDKKNIAYNYLLTQYAGAGYKDDVYRIWEVYKQVEKRILNKGYMSMLVALFKLNDIKGAEKIFEEWETQNLSDDTHLPNFMIGACAKRGHMESAENLMNKIILKGGKLDEWTWYNMIKGYVQNNDILKAVEAMKEAIKVCECIKKPSNAVFATCFNFLKIECKIEGLEEFVRVLGEHNIISVDVQWKLLNYVKDQTSECYEAKTL